LQEDYFLVLSIHTAVLSVPAAHSVSVIFIFLCFKGAMLFAMSKSPSIVLTRLDIQRLDEMLDTLDGPADLLDALENEIQRAKVVGHDRVGADIVTMNSRVRFVDETSGREMVLTLVYPDKAGTEGTISVLAPVGIALLGLKKGQSIDWTGPNGRPLKLRIIDIEYQPEANGDFHL
jgi:regulator of nucleoside diphosphate kinase